eukprot:CAMPEP_0178993692 /NCGR_PEP_ID=MMETSP0795-20121207/6846_1 /TAXON_ID=88552 /ORGANISM="Amoebophrya sp., Strain Ameob2" /LENGTH=96 /DNA_ID=CAMNT_0020685783 /DNA_START=351 /DNA_END=641 /DNA_ORIENTATION=-
MVLRNAHEVVVVERSEDVVATHQWVVVRFQLPQKHLAHKLQLLVGAGYPTLFFHIPSLRALVPDEAIEQGFEEDSVFLEARVPLEGKVLLAVVKDC